MFKKNINKKLNYILLKRILIKKNNKFLSIIYDNNKK